MYLSVCAICMEPLTAQIGSFFSVQKKPQTSTGQWRSGWILNVTDCFQYSSKWVETEIVQRTVCNLQLKQKYEATKGTSLFLKKPSPIAGIAPNLTSFLKDLSRCLWPVCSTAIWICTCCQTRFLPSYWMAAARVINRTHCGNMQRRAACIREQPVLRWDGSCCSASGRQSLTPISSGFLNALIF